MLTKQNSSQIVQKNCHYFLNTKIFIQFLVINNSQRHFIYTKNNKRFAFPGDIVGNFIQRVTTQLNHVKHLLRTLFDVVSTHQIPTKGELTRDAFGLHTIIVTVTSAGKVICSEDFWQTKIQKNRNSRNIKFHVKKIWLNICENETGVVDWLS